MEPGVFQAWAAGYSAGDTMPQNCNFEVRRRGAGSNTCKANGLVSGQVPGIGLVNEAVTQNGCPATATKISESTPDGMRRGIKQQCSVNGYINHGYKGKSPKGAPPRILRKQGGAGPAVNDASASVRVSSRDISGVISVSGASSLDTVALHNNSDQMAPKSNLSAAKNQRRRKKHRRKNRDTKVVFPENSALPLMPPQEKEDWENEIREAETTDWEIHCFGIRPYGPEDVLNFASRDLKVQRRSTADLPLTGIYIPATRHPCPIQWSCYNVPTEPDQFADADDAVGPAVSGGCVQRPAADGLLNGLSHHESGGGCCMGGVEHRSLHL